MIIINQTHSAAIHMISFKLNSLFAACIGAVMFATLAYAAEEPVLLKLSIQDHLFSPTELHAPSGKPLAISITNYDDSTEEFESYDFDREQRIKAKETSIVKLGPLKPGRYPFFGDFHRKTAQGVLVVD